MFPCPKAWSSVHLFCKLYSSGSVHSHLHTIEISFATCMARCISRCAHLCAFRAAFTLSDMPIQNKLFLGLGRLSFQAELRLITCVATILSQGNDEYVVWNPLFSRMMSWDLFQAFMLFLISCYVQLFLDLSVMIILTCVNCICSVSLCVKRQR